MRHGGTTGRVSGTSEIHVVGACDIDAPNLTTGDLANKVVLNSGAGNQIYIDGPAFFDLGNTLYLSGDIVTEAGAWATAGGGGNTYSRGRVVNAP